MAIEFWTLGKSSKDKYHNHTMEYLKLCQRYHKVQLVHLDKSLKKSADPKIILQTESDFLLQKIQSKGYEQAHFVLLDEKGKHFGSREFSSFIQNHFNYQQGKLLVFIAGGAYGFGEHIYAKVPQRVSLSKMTFPHDLVRLVFMEQLFRAFTILANEKYHND